MSEIIALVEENKALLSETEIVNLLSELKIAYQVLKNVKPTIEKSLDICHLSHDGLSTLILDIETCITDLEG